MTTTSPVRITLPLFVAAESLSLFGTAAIGIVLPWLVLSRTGDPSIAGLVAAVAAVPSIAATLVGGWLIDHVGQRRMSVIADVGSAVSVAGWPSSTGSSASTSAGSSCSACSAPSSTSRA